MKRKNILTYALYALVMALSLFVLFSASGFQRDAPSTGEITHIKQALVQVDGGEWKKINLPHIFSDLPPQTPISLVAPIYPEMDEGVFVQVDYAPAVVQLNGRTAFVMGKAENYPRIMHSSGREIHVVETYGDGREMELRVDYETPSHGRRFTIHEPMVGSAKEILMERGERYGLTMLLSVVQVACGIAMMLISVYVGLIDRKGLLFLWLGLFSMLTGLWFFGDNKAAVAIFPQSAFLYLASYIGLFSAPIVLLRFIRESIAFEDDRLIRGMENFFSLTALTLLLLQITGVYPFYCSVLPFFLLLTVGILLLNLITLWEYRHTQNIDAKRFPLPMGVILISDIFGLMGILYPLNHTLPILHQCFILLFLLIIGVFVGIYVKDSLDLQRQMTRLAYEEKIIHIQNEEQRDLAAQIVKNEEALSRQRHDLRHHLAMVQELAGDNERLQNYLTSLALHIPRKRMQFCENSVVNAVISHYAFRCEEDGIKLSMKLAVPETGKEDTDSDLCVIFSNLLENAVEACQRMESKERFIHLNSTIHHHILTITMDNSFNGEIIRFGERFRSAKRNDYGIGLASVQSIAEQANGGTDFRAEENIFKSSVYLRLP